MGATAAIVAAAIGTGMSAAGQLKAGSAQKRVAEINARAIEQTAEINAQLIEEGTGANAEILAFNARMLEAQARDSVRRGFEDEDRFRIGVRQLIGAQRAGFAGQGIEVETGTALDIQADTAYQAEFDALTIRTNAAREAWGFRVDAESERIQERALRKLGTIEAASTRRIGRVQALSARLGGGYAESASRYGAASTILGSTSSILLGRYGFGRHS